MLFYCSDGYQTCNYFCTQDVFAELLNVYSSISHVAMWSERERKTGGVREGEREGVGEREGEKGSEQLLPIH